MDALDAPHDASAVLPLRVERPVAGGEVLARDADGAVVLVRGGLPGEFVRAEVAEVRRGVRRATVVEVLDASPERVEPPCPHVAHGCGGCDLQHLAPAAQPAHKRAVVLDALRRIGGVVDVDVEFAPAAAAEGYRTTVRAAVVGGRAGYRMARSHDVVVPASCLTAHPLVEELLVAGRFGDATEVVLRAGSRTGERLVLASPGATGVVVPDDVVVVGDDELAAGRRAWFHEEVGGRRWRVSARSFFQASPEGAESLVEAVVELAGDVLRPGVHLADLYAGVGLFSGALLGPGGPAEGGTALVVERSASSVADARVNLDGLDARVVRADIDRWRPSPAELVVADPSRQGLGRRGVEAVTRTAADAVVLVSCDAAALGRDARLLGEAGYRLERARLVDLFPHTHHLEVVSRFVPS